MNSNGQGYSWLPGGNQRFSPPRGGRSYIPKYLRPPHCQPYSQLLYQHPRHQLNAGGNFYRLQGGGYGGDNWQQLHSIVSSDVSSSYNSNSSVFYTPSSGGHSSFRFRGGSAGRKRDWSTAAAASAAGSFAKSSMLADPWTGLPPVPVPENCGGGLVLKSGQTHTFLTPRAAAEAVGETNSSTAITEGGTTFVSFSEAN